MHKVSRSLLGITAALAVISGAAFFLGSDPSQPEPRASDDGSPAPDLVQDKQPVEASPEPQLPGVKETEHGLDFDEAMKAKLRDISEAYQERTQYPEFSVPINPDQLESKYRADIAVPSDVPARLGDPDSPTLSILPNQSRYFAGDSMLVSAEIIGLSEQETSTVSARLLRGGETIAYATVTPTQESAHSYHLDFGALELRNVDWKEVLTIEAEFAFRGKSHRRGPTVEYVATVASIEGVAPSEVEDEYLRIPVYVSTEKPGRHRLQANLLDASTGTPLVHLRAEEDLESRDGSLVLKAHIAALKQSGSEGPYELKDLKLTRMPTSPNYITEYGRVDEERYPVDGHDFSDYLDEPYVNEKADRIARELQRIGS